MQNAEVGSGLTCHVAFCTATGYSFLTFQRTFLTKKLLPILGFEANKLIFILNYYKFINNFNL